MRDLSAAITTHLTSRAARRAHLLVWINARDRNTGAPASIGFWTGADQADFAVGGANRGYFAAGALLKMTPMALQSGLQVRNTRLTFSKIPPEVQLAVRGYETREQACQIHVAYFDAQTHQLIDAPVRVFKGVCVGLKIPRQAKGSGNATVDLTLQSSAKELTRTLPLKKSDEALQARAPGDRIRRFTDISGSVESVWGEMRASAPRGAAPPAAQPIDDREIEGR